MWLKDLLPHDIPNARIFTYGYDSDTRSFTHTSTQSILHHAETFVADLTLARSGSPESRGYNPQAVSTYAILFFGTPHSGANGVEIAQWMTKLLSIYMFTDDTILKDLNRDSNQLQGIQKLYLSASEGIKSIFFYEALPTPLMKGVAEL
ncbi:12162_t:CDS:2, partial [Acaulospora colombiana]